MTSDTDRPASWGRRLAPFKQPRLGRSLFEVVVTLAGLFSTWAAEVALWTAGLPWAALVLIPLSALFLVRTFMIQHDCGHGSFFVSKSVNNWVGRMLSLLTLTPYEYWRSTHAVHHATSGDLDRREAGAVRTLTVGEYQALSPLGRLGYRLYRHPAVMFGIGPIYVFFLQHRVPVDMLHAGWRGWLSTLGSTAGTAVLLTAASWAFGWAPVLTLFGLTALMAGTIGVWLFYVQHQFDGTDWVRSDDWTLPTSALASSSHFDLPQPLRWFTADIGVHHVHHLSSRIPFYRLQEVLRAHPSLREMNRITIGDSFRTAALALWDETNRRLVSFRQAAAA